VSPIFTFEAIQLEDELSWRGGEGSVMVVGPALGLGPLLEIRISC
jgi:hypothetical protein